MSGQRKGDGTQHRHKPAKMIAVQKTSDRRLCGVGKRDKPPECVALRDDPLAQVSGDSHGSPEQGEKIEMPGFPRRRQRGSEQGGPECRRQKQEEP